MSDTLKCPDCQGLYHGMYEICPVRQQDKVSLADIASPNPSPEAQRALDRALEASTKAQQAVIDEARAMTDRAEEQEICGKHVYWWDGEYDGNCELPKDHLDPFHYDGISYFDDENNRRDEEQAKAMAWRDQAVTEAVIAELKQIEPPEQCEYFAKLAGYEHCRICGFNAVEFRKYITDRIKQLNASLGEPK